MDKHSKIQVDCGIPPQRKIPPAFVDFKCPLCYTWKHAAVLESVDKADLKSAGRNSVRVRVPSAAPLRNDLWMSSDDRASAFISTAKVFLRSKSQSLTLDCDFVLQICQLIHSVHIAQLRDLFSALPEKRGGRKGALGERLLPTASEFRQEPDTIECISHHLTLRNLTTRRPSFRHQI